MEKNVLLRLDGEVERPLDLCYEDLSGFAESEQVSDVSRFQPSRRGDGVALEALLSLAKPKPEANYLTLHAGRDDFHVSIPLDPVRAEGIVVYKVGSAPLRSDQGGPIRFLIRNPAACHTDELDDCANVKYLDRIELTVRKGRDTRPHDDAAHAALHEQQKS
jgi:DMSO/TMAO reductase YedYZ molybdopterin-dependent catalytic subunit